MVNFLRKLVRDESGQDIIEYALLAAGIAVLLVPIVPQIGATLQSVYQRVNAAVVSIP